MEHSIEESHGSFKVAKGGTKRGDGWFDGHTIRKFLEFFDKIVSNR